MQSGNKLADDCAKFLMGVAAQGGVQFRRLPVEQARAAVASMTELDARCTTACRVTNLEATPSCIPCRLYSPVEPADDFASRPVIVYLHGGGWMLGNLDGYDALCRHLATRTGSRVLSVGYRLAPEHKFPAAYDDGLAVIRWLMSSPAELDGPVNDVAVAGDSAGGALAASAAVACGTAQRRVAGVLLLYPVTDISRFHPSYDHFGSGLLLEADDMKYFAESYAPTVAMREDWRVSPLRAADLSLMPPTTLLTCGWDVLRDEGRAFGARLIEAGVRTTYLEAANHIHGIATLRAAIPSAQAPIDQAIDEFCAQLRGDALAVSDRS